MFQQGHTPAHKNKITTTDPLRGEDIQKVREFLKYRPRDLAIWSVGTNSALRGGDICNLQWDDTEDDGERITVLLREKKTGKLRKIILNPVTSADLRAWRRHSDTPVIFASQRGGALTVASLGRMVKTWCREAGVEIKRVASHSMRKTWVRAHADRGVPLHTLMWALNHNSERQTATYCGLLTDEIAGLYEHVV